MRFFVRIVCFILLCLNAIKLFSTPSLMYWAWEAPQNLTSIDTNTSGVAELALSVFIDASGPHYYARQQPLKAPKNGYRIAVVHITARPGRKPLLDTKTAQQIAQKISETFRKKSYRELQIDFEALKVQRPFYKQLLTSLRHELGKQVIISMTALGSWCTNERWIQKAQLPVDYVVPMYFSISHDKWLRQAFINHFPKKMAQLAPECQSAIGLATFEMWHIPLKANVPIFAFTNGRWTAQTIKQAQDLAFVVQH